jgi:hypothetical protein
VKALGDLGFGTELQREMLRRIIDGRRTITELVELICGTSRDDQGFKADFMKVSRAIRRLESRGLIATRLFVRRGPLRGEGRKLRGNRLTGSRCEAIRRHHGADGRGI